MNRSSEKSPGPSRKRRRPTTKQNGGKAKQQLTTTSIDADADGLLKPHTRRLLRLIQEGTAEHAKIAAEHLTQLTAEAEPPVLWDILGRLQAFLSSPNWRARENASLALEGVAKHLPKADQEDFLRAEKEAESDGDRWLTVQALKGGKLEMIVEHGQQLMSTAESQIDSEEEELRRLDSDFSSGKVTLDDRVRAQREMLATRLGLHGVIAAIGDAGNSSMSFVTSFGDEDFSSSKGGKRKRRKKKDVVSEPALKSIRHLLVSQASLIRDSHSSPQELLANELVYRMFDSSWYVRHGSLLGILSLLRAWSVKEASTNHAGAWVQDIIARCICIITLDRFEDYSGASSSVDSGVVVAPVRESACQVLALALAAASEYTRLDLMSILSGLLESDEWEVRHGSLLAFKYLVIVDRGLCASYKPLYSLAIESLSDDNDDVVGVAAQVLKDMIASESMTPSKSLCEAVDNSLLRTRLVSSCILDLLSLHNALAKPPASVQGMPRAQAECGPPSDALLEKVAFFLDCDAFSIKRVALVALRNSFQVVFDQRQNGGMDPSLDKPFVSLFIKTFNLFRNMPPSLFVDAESADRELFEDERWLTWTTLVSYLPKLSCTFAELGELERRLVLGYLSIGSTSNDDLFCSWGKIFEYPLLAMCQQSAKALAHFQVHGIGPLGANERLHSWTQRVLHMCLVSPLVPHVVYACLLASELGKASTGPSQDTWLWIVPILSAQLHSTPLCSQLSSLNENHTILQLKQMCDSKLIDQWHVDSSSSDRSSQFRESMEVLQVVVTEGGVSEDRINLSCLLGAALVTFGIHGIPTKPSTLIQAFMNVIKNSPNAALCKYAASCLGDLLMIINPRNQFPSAHTKAWAKIITNLCFLIDCGSEAQQLNAGFSIACFVELACTDTPLSSIGPIWDFLIPIRQSSSMQKVDDSLLRGPLRLVCSLCKHISCSHEILTWLLSAVARPQCDIACTTDGKSIRDLATESCIAILARVPVDGLAIVIPATMGYLTDNYRYNACLFLKQVVLAGGVHVTPYVHALLPKVMSLMAVDDSACRGVASSIFALLVRLAPLVDRKSSGQEFGDHDDGHASAVVRHLIHGEPLPALALPEGLSRSLENQGIHLRGYQAEGIAWLQFLQSVGLNGALCDEMGLGKTLQALVAIAIAHTSSEMGTTHPTSLIVCPSTLVKQWQREIDKCFGNGGVFNCVVCVAPGPSHSQLPDTKNPGSSLVITSYENLRSGIEVFAGVTWCCVVLDEGHLLKNPRTQTARASRQLLSKFKLVLTGTPVENSVMDLWATFDFLMPGFLGNHAWFSSEYANPIKKGERTNATVEEIAERIEKLKRLHQQVLPFILRREKSHVLQELPEKQVTVIPCSMSPIQLSMYQSFSRKQNISDALKVIRDTIGASPLEQNREFSPSFKRDDLKILTFLRLVCTHPLLVAWKDRSKFGSMNSAGIEASGKLLVLRDLLQNSGIGANKIFGADGDSSLLYCAGGESQSDDIEDVLQPDDHQSGESIISSSSSSVAKCLIFSQFSASLDVVEELLFKAHMPQVQYLRMDGSVSPKKRPDVAERFNTSSSIQVLLLTTRVGGLGLNLTGADTVIFLEQDWNPHKDLQAMDRAHRIGQRRCVNVYKLVTSSSIEEQIMRIQDVKLATARAVVNTDNSSLYSMGTDRLLDIFAIDNEDGTNGNSNKTLENEIDSLIDQYLDDYKSLSKEEFVKRLGN